MSDTARKRLLFHGRVQGVGFRAFCREAASSRGVRGWVRNQSDGTVEMEAEASVRVLSDLLLYLGAGHPWARVDRMDAVDISPRGDEAEGFQVTC